MSEDKFDVIIVGGGMAGAITAMLMAQEGLEVVVVERGNYSGAKNMTGGRLYAHSFEKIIPDFAKVAPLERKIAKERVSLMTETSNFFIDYSSDKIMQEGKDSYTVLRGVFDRWLMEKAEEAGAMPVTGILVEDLVMKDGKVVGIIAGGDEMLADVVILADGANSLLMEKCGLEKRRITPHEIAVGAKEVIELGERAIEDRFNLNPGEGCAWLMAGSPSDGKIGGGLIYTNKDTISLGVVVTLSEFEETKMSVHEMLERMKAHPSVKPLIRDGKLVEYSGHMVGEAGYNALPEMYGDGVIAIGDAAGLVMNLGYTVRGMDLAVASCVAATQAVKEAKEKGDFSKGTLAKYKQLLDESFAMKEMKYYRKFPKFMENPRIFNDYPVMIDEICGSLFMVDGGNPRSLLSKIIKPVWKVGPFGIMKDAIQAVRAL